MSQAGPRNTLDYLRHVVDSCDLDSASIFLIDRASRVPKITYLQHYGVSQEAQAKYVDRGVFKDDPFTAPELAECLSRETEGTLILFGDDRLQRSLRSTAIYRDYIGHHDLDVVGASLRRLMPGVYSTIGFHRRRGRRRGQVPPNQARLTTFSARLQNMTANHLLTEMMIHSEGVAACRSICFGANRNPLDRLTHRECEIALLVSQGHRNKQVAYATGLSEYTIENHLRRIYRKLTVNNRSSLTALIVGQGVKRAK